MDGYMGMDTIEKIELHVHIPQEILNPEEA